MDYTVGARYIVPLRITVLYSIANRYIYLKPLKLTLYEGVNLMGTIISLEKKSK
jgi:hypothetical protein